MMWRRGDRPYAAKSGKGSEIGLDVSFARLLADGVYTNDYPSHLSRQ